MIVVDASIALAWMLADERDALAERALDVVRDRSAFAPSLWYYEVANALLMADRRGRLDRPVRDVLADLVTLNITIVDSRGFPLTEYDLAVEHQLTVYDSVYLHVAVERGIPLATLDGKLARAAKSRNVLFR